MFSVLYVMKPDSSLLDLQVMNAMFVKKISWMESVSLTAASATSVCVSSAWLRDGEMLPVKSVKPQWKAPVA